MGAINCEYIMGSCWPSERSERTTLPTPLPKNNEEKMERIKVNGGSSLLRSYAFEKKEGDCIFEKRVYDWKSIPISNQFHCRGKLYFAVRNRGIKEDNFLVGVIKRTAITSQLSMPWKTPSCICYESHKNKGESGLIFEGKVAKASETIGENDTIRVVMDDEEVEFKSGRKTLAYMKLPVGFLND
jgi:hypothetical protein